MSTSKKYWNSLIILLLTVFIVIASSLVYSVYSQENESIKNIDGAPVELGEETILYIKNSADGLNPEQRAEKISKELEGIFKIRAIDLDELDVEQRGENKVILLRNFLVTLTPQDVKSLENSQENSEIEIINKLKTGAKNYYEEQALESTVLSILIVFSLFVLILIPFYNSTFTKWYNNIEEFIAHVYQKVKNTIGSIYNLIPRFRHPDNRVINRICEFIPHLEFPNRDEQVFEFKYKNESLDNKGRLIRNIYFYNRDFIIYQTIDSVEWMINSQQDETLINPLEYSQRINKIIFSLADLESLNPKKIGRPQTINKLIAQGIKLALQDDISNSQQVLEKAKERLKALRITYYKQHYLIASFYAASLIIFTMISINYMHKFFGEHLINILQNLQISAELTTVVICGCLGGLLSVSYGIKEIVINPDDDFVVGGISRIFIAVISSIIIYITVKADIVPDLSRLLLNDSSRPDLWRVGFVSVLAGFIESLVPNLLKKQAPKEDKQNNNTT